MSWNQTSNPSSSNLFLDNISLTNQEQSFGSEKKISTSSSFGDLLIFSDEFDKINQLSNQLDNLFLTNKEYVKTNIPNDISTNDYVGGQIIFNQIYEKEFERGNIEYKRSLESYNQNDKTNKLIRQIHWRIYEGVVSIDRECCYYIVGIEDSGQPSFLTPTELINSLHFISKCIDETEISCSYLFVKNNVLNYDYMVVNFFPKETNFIDYF